MSNAVDSHLTFMPKLYAQEGTTFNDITPIRLTTSAGDATFSASNGDATITVTESGHGAVKGDFVTFVKILPSPAPRNFRNKIRESLGQANAVLSVIEATIIRQLACDVDVAGEAQLRRLKQFI